jgi:hypothetical protein
VQAVADQTDGIAGAGGNEDELDDEQQQEQDPELSLDAGEEEQGRAEVGGSLRAS